MTICAAISARIFNIKSFINTTVRHPRRKMTNSRLLCAFTGTFHPRTFERSYEQPGQPGISFPRSRGHSCSPLPHRELIAARRSRAKATATRHRPPPAPGAGPRWAGAGTPAGPNGETDSRQHSVSLGGFRPNGVSEVPISTGGKGETKSPLCPSARVAK